jgi:hypothetical protein
MLSDCPVAPTGVDAIANVTLVPATGLPPASVTVTTNGAPSAVLITLLWLFPEVRAMFVAGPTVAVDVNVTGLPVSPADVAVTEYVPTLFPNVSVLLACPLPSVEVNVVLSDCPVAPTGVDAIANVTLVPATGLPPASVTVTTNGAPSAVLITLLWLFPEVRAMFVAAPTVAVDVNVTGLPVAPADVAVTV